MIINARMSEQLLNTTNDLLNHLATTASCCANQDEEVLHEAEETRSIFNLNDR